MASVCLCTNEIEIYEGYAYSVIIGVLVVQKLVLSLYFSQGDALISRS